MCGDCHQFNFPVLRAADGVALSMTRHPMQATVADFLAGPHKEAPRQCLTCHSSPAGHAFAGGHELSMLTRAIATSWCRRGEDIVLEVANVGAGHRVPTGDIHRHLLARVWKSTAPQATFEAFFGRRFRLVEGGGRETIWDSTLRPGQRRSFVIPLRSLSGAEPVLEPVEGEEALDEGDDQAADEPINLAVTYVYTADEVPRPRRDPGEPVTAQLSWQRARFDEIPTCPDVAR